MTREELASRIARDEINKLIISRSGPNRDVTMRLVVKQMYCFLVLMEVAGEDAAKADHSGN